MSVFRGPVTPVSQRARKLRALGALRSATPQLRSISKLRHCAIVPIWHKRKRLSLDFSWHAGLASILVDNQVRCATTDSHQCQNDYKLILWSFFWSCRGII